MRIDAPARLLLYCNRCHFVHLFTLNEAKATYGPSDEVSLPESLMSKPDCTKAYTVLSVLVTYSSQEVDKIHELMVPEQCRV